MSIIQKIPTDVRGRVRRFLPDRLADGIRDTLMRHYNSQSMVSRERPFVVWARRRLLHRKPVLYHFEIHVTDHCNLNCKGCAHFSNLCKPTFADLGEFERDMRAMASHFSHVEQIFLLGGEPLLHPEVASFVRVARSVFPKTRIYLMTNGTLVTKQAEAFWEALHETGVVLLCDSYPIGLPVDEINRLAEEHGVAVEWTTPRDEFFKIPIDPAGGHDARSSFRNCQGYNNCPIVRDGKLYPCAYVAFADVFRERFGIDGLEVTEADFVDIHAERDSEKVADFLRRAVPWCSYCDMESRELFEWGRSKRAVEEWTNAC